MKYNYVFFCADVDYHRISNLDLEGHSDIRTLYSYIDTKNPLLIGMYRLHTSPKTNKYFKLPWQSIWNGMAFRGQFPENKPICFVFNARSVWLLNGVDKYLRKKYPGCRIVAHFTDLVRYAYPKEVEKLVEKLDLCLSFDHADAEKYGMGYYPLVYSPYDVPDDPEIAESDVYFVGKAKDRLPQILTAYEKLRDAGLKCEFYITGVAPENQKYADEIHYCGQMSYVENLKHVKKSKCLLEIMQGGGHGYTLRVCEAIMYDKKLITDNPEIAGAPFFAPERISVFRDVNDIDPSFVTAEPLVAEFGWKDRLSPLRLLEYIDERI